MAPKRTIKFVTQRVDEYVEKLAKIGVAFLESREDLIEQMYNSENPPLHFKTQFIRVATETQSMYIHPNLVIISDVLRGHTKIRPLKGTIEFATQCVDEYIAKLTDMGLSFVLPRLHLIKQICNFEKEPSRFPTLFKRLATSEEPEYIHPTPVQIKYVLSGQTKIWSDADKKKHQDEVNAVHFPRGVDTNGDKETERFKALLKLFSEITDKFDWEETTRGSMTDIIVTLKTDDKIVFGLQLATADAMHRKQFSFYKSVEELIRYLDENLVILLIAMVENQVVGVYMIPPTQDVKDKFATFKSTTHLNPTLMNKYKTQPGTLNHYLETFRYIHPDFVKGVKGDNIKDWSTFPADFMKLYKDYPSIVTTSEHLSSLFVDPGHRTEWVCDMSFDVHVANVLNIIQKRIHGQRGDMHLDFGEFQLNDERKTLIVTKRSKSVVDVANFKNWQLPLRIMGKQGLHPSKVRVNTCFIRADRRQTYPNQLDQIIGFVLLCVITASGNLALRPDKPESIHLYMTCDVANRSEYIELMADKIGADVYPDQETYMSARGMKTRMRAVFYYDELANPDGKRLAELRELYKTFANRTPTEDAIRAYETAVSDELIDDEKKRLASS